MTSPATWRRGLPPGRYYPGMLDEYEARGGPGRWWHRRRSREGAWLHASARAVLDCSERPRGIDEANRIKLGMLCK